MYLGYDQLVDYFENNASVDFSRFVNAERENIALWSATLANNSPQNLFSLWKNRFLMVWKNKRTAERVPRFISTSAPKDFVLTVVCRIKYDDTWDNIFKHAELIGRNRQEYKLQGLEILAKASKPCAEDILRSFEPVYKQVATREESGENSNVHTSNSTSQTNSTSSFGDENASLPSNDDDTVDAGEDARNSNVSSQQSNSTSSSYVLESDESNEEEEEMPTKVDETYDYLVSTNLQDDITLENCSMMWTLPNGTNMSAKFIAARNTIVSACSTTKLKISDEEQLALSGILLFDPDKLSNIFEHQDYLEACKNLDTHYKQFTGLKSPHIIAEHLDRIRCGDTTSLFDSALDSASLPYAVKTVLRSLMRTYSRQYCIKGLNENTLIKDFLVPMLDSIFPNDDYTTTYAADKEIKESCHRFVSMDPSLQKHAKKADYSVVHNPTQYALLTVEAKSCQNQSRSSSDVVKIGKYLKDLIDAAEAKNYQGLQLVGLVSKGETINVYVVEHKHDLIYTMFKLDTLYIPVTYKDIHHALPAFEVLSRLKLIVDSNVTTMNRPKQPSVLKKIHTYHTPVALPGQRVKRLANKNSAAFKAARRKLF